MIKWECGTNPFVISADGWQWRTEKARTEGKKLMGLEKRERFEESLERERGEKREMRGAKK